MNNRQQQTTTDNNKTNNKTNNETNNENVRQIPRRAGGMPFYFGSEWCKQDKTKNNKGGIFIIKAHS